MNRAGPLISKTEDLAMDYAAINTVDLVKMATA